MYTDTPVREDKMVRKAVKPGADVAAAGLRAARRAVYILKTRPPPDVYAPPVAAGAQVRALVAAISADRAPSLKAANFFEAESARFGRIFF